MGGVGCGAVQWWAGPGCDREQVVVEAEEVGQCPLGRGECAQTGWDWGLDVVVRLAVEGVLVAFPDAVGGQPGEIERSEVAGGQFGADSGDLRQQRLGVVVEVEVTGLGLVDEVEHDELVAVIVARVDMDRTSACWAASRGRSIARNS
ncbi:hypothetical protein ACQPW3_31195 [Actinosynnema sp. CA-248983]